MRGRIGRGRANLWGRSLAPDRDLHPHARGGRLSRRTGVARDRIRGRACRCARTGSRCRCSSSSKASRSSQARTASAGSMIRIVVRTRPASERRSGWQTRRRPPWSCTWRIVSWRRWWRRPSLARPKLGLAAAYADLVRDGRWFSPTREAIDAFVRTIQPRVTGSIRLNLFKGECRVLGRTSPFEWGASPAAHAADRVDRLPAEGLVS